MRSSTSSFRPEWSPEFNATHEVPLTTLDLFDRHTTVYRRFARSTSKASSSKSFEGSPSRSPLSPIEYQEKVLDLTLDCLRYLQRFGDARVNFTPYDESRFLYDEWVLLSEIEPRLHEVLEHTPWGDLFVDWRGRLSV